MFAFGIATEPHEFEQIHRLNYRTFVEEIPQHAPDPSGRLVDRFHEENTYIICLDASTVIGMVAMRRQRPFSLDAKVANLNDYLPASQCICEIRLLAIEPARRKGRIAAGLFQGAWQQALEWGCDLAIISGTTRQKRLYENLGFASFGPLVGTPGAYYQPMYVTSTTMQQAIERLPASHLREQSQG